MSHPIGFVVSWRVPTIIQLAALRDGLHKAGLNAPELAPDLQPASLVARTAGYVARSGSAKDSHKLSRPAGHMVRQITREDAVADQLTYTRESAIGFDDTTGKLTTDDPAIAGQLPSLAKEVTETRTASDVTRIIQHIVSEAGSDLMPVREQGGAYFIPAGNDVITKIDTVLTEIGGKLSRFACTIGHGSDESVATTIGDYLVQQIGELQEAVDALGEKGMRSDVKNRRLSRVAELKEKIGNYAALLGTGTEKLNAQLERAELMLLAKLGPSADDEETAAAA